MAKSILKRESRDREGAGGKSRPSPAAAPRASERSEGNEWIAPRELESLLEVMARHDLAELEVSRGDRKLSLRRGRVASAPIATTFAAPASAPAPAAKPAPAAAPELEDGLAFVTSPLVGTFYRRPSPDAANFVDVGTKIRAGQRLCIVEAMKLMNEIEAEIEGEIVEILVDNGKPVEYGQKLFKVRTK